MAGRLAEGPPGRRYQVHNLERKETHFGVAIQQTLNRPVSIFFTWTKV